MIYSWVTVNSAIFLCPGAGLALGWRPGTTGEAAVGVDVDNESALVATSESAAVPVSCCSRSLRPVSPVNYVATAARYTWQRSGVVCPLFPLDLFDLLT